MLFLKYFLALIPLFFITGEPTEPENFQEDIIAWSTDYELKWTDFQALPKNSSHLDAYTMLGISLEVVSQNNGNVDMGVFGYFEKDKSWVKAGEKTDNLLNHERKHFDLCEIYRRILIKRLVAGNPYTVDNFNKRVGDTFNKTFQEYTKEQERYDFETNHSQKKEQQAQWNNAIVKRLNDLEKYQDLIAPLKVE